MVHRICIYIYIYSVEIRINKTTDQKYGRLYNRELQRIINIRISVVNIYKS